MSNRPLVDVDDDQFFIYENDNYPARTPYLPSTKSVNENPVPITTNETIVGKSQPESKPKPKPITQQTVGQILANMANEIIKTPKDIYRHGFNKKILTENNRLIYFGLFFIIIFILYLILWYLTIAAT